MQQALGDIAQQRVAELVAERVVDHLEAVEIDEQHREPPAVSFGLVDGMVQPLAEHDAVGQPGERVVRGDEAQRLFRLLALQVLRDLAADRLQHGGELGIRLAHGATEGHDAEGVGAKQQRHA